MTFLIVPSAIAFLVFGYLIVGALFRRGVFGASDNWLVYLVLAGYSLGLVASTTSRLLNNVFYARSLTRIPARIAIERVLLSAAIGLALMFWLDRFSVNEMLAAGQSGSPLFLGALGLALGAGISSWYELVRLRGAMRRVLGEIPLPWGRVVTYAALAGSSTLPGLGLWYLLRGWPAMVVAPLVLAIYGILYLGASGVLGVGELDAWVGRKKRGREEKGEL